MPLDVKTSIKYTHTISALVSDNVDTGYKVLSFHLNDMSGPGVDIIIAPMRNEKGEDTQIPYADAIVHDLSELMEAYGQMVMAQINSIVMPKGDPTRLN